MSTEAEHAERPLLVDTADQRRPRYINALVVPVDNKPEIRPVEPCEMAYHLIIGGFVDVVHQADKWKVLASEGCRLDGTAANPFANTLVRSLAPTFDDVLCGHVIVVGTGPDGEDVDVPTELLLQAKALTAD